MKKKQKEKKIVLILLAGVMLMSIGFAAYSEILNVEGTVNIGSNKWSIGYVDTTYKETSGSVAATSKTITEKGYTFATTLSKPGDFYEATLDVKNGGTFAAKVTEITMSTLTEAQQKYLKYTVIYDGNEYTETTSGLALDLAAGATKTLKVRVDYVQPENSADLPSDDTEITVTGSLKYEIAE